MLIQHWHGIFQHKSNWADGTAFVTQCPLKPNGSVLHTFNARNQAGTFWYHSHLSAQYCDGLRGPLVIYDPDDPLKYMYDVDDRASWNLFFILQMNSTLPSIYTDYPF